MPYMGVLFLVEIVVYCNLTATGKVNSCFFSGASSVCWEKYSTLTSFDLLPMTPYWEKKVMLLHLCLLCIILSPLVGMESHPFR